VPRPTNCYKVTGFLGRRIAGEPLTVNRDNAAQIFPLRMTYPILSQSLSILTPLPDFDAPMAFINGFRARHPRERALQNAGAQLHARYFDYL
jgi:hypothetical protein